MCGGAFWTGGELTSMRLQSAMNEKRNNRQDALLEKLTELAADNKRRLDLAERLAAQSR